MKPVESSSVFIEHRQEIEVFLARKLACSETAADLTQEVFLRFFCSPSSINAEIVNIRAYLYKMATNIAINHQLAQRRRDILQEEYSREVKDQVDTISPERIVSDEERLQTMSIALKELPPLTQQVFILTRIKGMKQADVAVQLNIHITTVEKNLSKAVRHCYTRAMDE